MAASLVDSSQFEIYCKGNMKTVDTIMERYRDGKIPIVKFEIAYSGSSRKVFSLIDKWIDIALQNGVKYLDVTVPNYSLSTSTILAAKSVRFSYLVSTVGSR
ncbi:hypothetical protein P3S68_023618 [Capsicum galapagoense]